MIGRLIAGLLFAGAMATTASAAVIVQQQSNGDYYASALVNGPSDQKYDLVIVGDGFTAAEQQAFNDRVSDVVVQALRTREPYASRMCALNIWRVNVMSTDTGVDHPNQGIDRNTELDVTYGNTSANEAERCVHSASPAKVFEAAGHAPEFDAVIVLANDAQWGGCLADQIVFSSLAMGAATIITHELGHKIAGLADEYTCYLCDGTDSNTSYMGPEPSQVNCTVAVPPAAIKWGGYIAAGTPLPTSVDSPQGVVGLWDGCNYAATQIFRPQSNCHMADTGSPFCAVCAGELGRVLAAKCTLCELARRHPACTGPFRTKPPWWIRRQIRRPIPICLSCPIWDLRDTIDIVISDPSVRELRARVVDDAGRQLAADNKANGELRLTFIAERGMTYWLEVDYPQQTLSRSLAALTMFRDGEVIATP